jgi:hypothetical protein
VPTNEQILGLFVQIQTIVQSKPMTVSFCVWEILSAPLGNVQPHEKKLSNPRHDKKLTRTRYEQLSPLALRQFR